MTVNVSCPLITRPSPITRFSRPYLGTRAIKGMTVGGMTECLTAQYNLNYNFLKLRFRIRSCFIMHLGKGLNTVQIFKGHLRREGIIPELIIYTVLDISLELKS